MKNIYILNAHEYYSFSPGKLNASFVEKAQGVLEEKGYAVKTLSMQDDYDANEEVEKHLWADALLIQSPVNWMGFPWSFKKYIDVVYTPTTDGRFCDGDGRHRNDPSLHYGSGGKLTGKKYMFSLTFNAPEAAFDDPDQYLFQGKGVDDLFFPMHMNYRFFAMESLPTFVAYDVMKNPDIEGDFKRFKAHISKWF